jgi:cytochrome c-type biogenesis protein CcmH
MLADGKSEAEIKQHFVEYYGARVLSEPPRSGFNWLIYVVPPMAIVAGIFILFRAMRAWSQPAETEAGLKEEEAFSSSDDEYIARMEEELKKRG